MGWTEERVKRLIAELDARTDEEWVAADEAAAEAAGEQTVITVPTALLPEIRRLLDHDRWKAENTGDPARATKSTRKRN